jgi:hypothetical protein
VGTDVLEDPRVPARVVVNPSTLALPVGGTANLTAVYTNEFGLAADIPATWSTSNATVASISAGGTVDGRSPGQTLIIAKLGGTADTCRLTVVANANAVARVVISSTGTSLEPGETRMLSASVFNINNELLAGRTVTWQSSNSAFAAVSASGVLTALTAGRVTVTAMAEEVTSNALEFTIGASRTGTFTPAGGYVAAGTATLRIVNNRLVLELGGDFRTSFALGTFIYLANNNTSGSTVRSAGVEIAEIRNNGAHTFDVTSVRPATTLGEFRYVIILCKPASLVFGSADLK